jgi:hypothetical protein
LPQPRFGDIRRFCAIDGWEEVKSATGRTGDHYRYRKTLSDGRILRTKASHGNDEIGDPKLWKRVWSEQLALDTEDQFWETLRSGEPPARASEARATAPEGESLPGWLVAKLVREVGLSSGEVAQLSEPEAMKKLHEYYSQVRGDSEA